MSYRVIPEIPKSERTLWSPERGGRVWQKIGKSRVPKYAFSPFTAKPRETYTFYADVEMRQVVESPPGTETKKVTIPVTTSTYLEFRDMVRSGEAFERLEEIVVARGGEAVADLGFWRNPGTKVYEE